MVDMAFGLCGNYFRGASPNQAGEAVYVWLRCSSCSMNARTHTHGHMQRRKRGKEKTEAKRKTLKQTQVARPALTSGSWPSATHDATQTAAVSWQLRLQINSVREEKEKKTRSDSLLLLHERKCQSCKGYFCFGQSRRADLATLATRLNSWNSFIKQASSFGSRHANKRLIPVYWLSAAWRLSHCFSVAAAFCKKCAHVWENRKDGKHIKSLSCQRTTSDNDTFIGWIALNNEMIL